MANWKTASEIAGRYRVGESRLLDFSQRGNLPLLRSPDGLTLFDEEVVAKIFQPREGEIVALAPPTHATLAVLGVSRLGERPTPHTRSTRQTHRRSPRAAGASEPEAAAATKAVG